MNEIIATIGTDEPEKMSDFLKKIVYREILDLDGFDFKWADDLEQFLLGRREQLVDYVLDFGLSNLMAVGPVNEDVLKAGDPNAKLLAVFSKFLGRIGVDRELIIADAYFFTASGPHYPGLVEAVLTPFISPIDDLIIITGKGKKKIDLATKTSIVAKLKTLKPTLNIVHKKSEDIHDRYWITNKRSEGIFTGSSLNGLGKRLSMIDRLSKSDVADIVSEMNRLKLI